MPMPLGKACIHLFSLHDVKEAHMTSFTKTDELAKEFSERMSHFLLFFSLKTSRQMPVFFVFALFFLLD